MDGFELRTFHNRLWRRGQRPLRPPAPRTPRPNRSARPRQAAWPDLMIVTMLGAPAEACCRGCGASISVSVVPLGYSERNDQRCRSTTSS
jgi:hypothetical protein